MCRVSSVVGAATYTGLKLRARASSSWRCSLYSLTYASLSPPLRQVNSRGAPLIAELSSGLDCLTWSVERGDPSSGG